MSATPRIVLATALILEAPRVARAGMPMVTITDVARARLQVISFFLVVLLASAFAIRAAWNTLARDFPRLPRLGYGGALGLVVLWGLLFVLVLTMISGARELLTPGAWEKVGTTYRLATPPTPAPPITPDPRQVGMEKLRAALWAHARTHDGALPDGAGPSPEAPEDAWHVPGTAGLRYVYLPGQPVDAWARSILAHEPAPIGGERYVLRASGHVERLTEAEFRRTIDPEGAPR